MWIFDDIWEYGSFLHTFHGLSIARDYLDWIYSTIDPTISFLYQNVLLNPFIIVLILVLLVLSLFTFSD